MVAGSPLVGAPADRNPEPLTAAARGRLAGLRAAGRQAMTGHSRAKFTHWTGQGDWCDTREVVLERADKAVKRDGEYKAVSSTRISVYDGITVTDAGKLDNDHLIPPANAWGSGVNSWTAKDEREEPPPAHLAEAEKTKMTEMLETRPS